MRFLIAEDDPISRVLLKRILLKGFDCQVIEASDGASAWGFLQDGPLPDLLFLDIMMPRRNGLQLLKDLRADKRFNSLRVIVCTALSDRATVTQVALLNVSGYVLKPFIAQKITEQVQGILGSPPTSPCLEESSAVQARLGIDGPTYLNLLEMLSQDVAQGLATVRTALANDDRRAAAMRLSAIASAGRNLGATRVVTVATKIESSIYTAVPSQLVADLQRLEEESQHLTQTIDSLAKGGVPVPASS